MRPPPVCNPVTCTFKHNNYCRGSYCVNTVFSPAYLRDRGSPHPFSANLSLKWDWGGAEIFDVDTSSTQNNALPYAFNFGWGEHCIVSRVSIFATVYLLKKYILDTFNIPAVRVHVAALEWMIHSYCDFLNT